MGYAAKLLSGGLQGFDLFSQLSLLSLLLSEYFINILHDTASFCNVGWYPLAVNELGLWPGYGSNLDKMWSGGEITDLETRPAGLRREPPCLSSIYIKMFKP